MPEETQNEPESVLKPDAPGDAETLDAMIAADEAADSEASKGRDAKGRFEAKTATPGQRLTPETISAKTGGTTDKAEAEAKPASASQTEQKPQENAEGGTRNAEQKPADEKPKSTYEKAKERQDGAWKQINEAKAQLEIERTAIEAERAAQRGTRSAERGTNGQRTYTAADYTQAAGQWETQAARIEARAKELEDAGDFAKADQAAAQAAELRDNAKAAREAARTAPEQRAGSDAGAPNAEAEYRRQWATVKTDLPEVLVQGSPFNAAVQEFIQRNPGVLQQPDGVFRAVLQTGRNIVAKLEREAMRVPELTKANAALSERIKGLEAELQKITSLGGGGGFQRGEGGRNFDQLSTREQEAALDQELAGHL